MKLLRAFLAEATKWDPEAFAASWRATVKRGGTRDDVTQEWGIDPQVASNRAYMLKVKLGYSLPDFRTQRGTGAGVGKPRKSADPEAIVRAVNAHHGDLGAAAKELGFTRSELYNVVRRIEVERPDLRIVRRQRGRPRLTVGIPTDEQFSEVWNTSDDRGEAYMRAVEAFPALDTDKQGLSRFDRVKALASSIRRRHEDGFLAELPDRRFSLNKQRADAPAPGEDYGDIFGEPSGAGEAPAGDTDDIRSDNPWDDKTDPDASLPSFDEPAEEPAVVTPQDRAPVVSLTASEQELVDAWNGADDIGEAVAQLRRSGWSLGQPERKGQPGLSPKQDLRARIKALRGRGVRLKSLG